MIYFSRDGTRVKLAVDLRLPFYEKRAFFFYWDAGSEWAAGLLADAMDKAFRRQISEALEEDYNEGWSAAKSKRAKKKTWFRRYL
jgi:hypothetical protein